MKFLLSILSLGALGAEIQANPIRRVVNLLEAMQKKVEEEGEKEEELYEKFVCYCKNNKGELDGSISEAAAKISQLESMVKEDTAAKTQVDEELVNHKKDRADSQSAVANATKQREKEKATFDKNNADTGANVKALGKAVDAIRTGLAGGAFLQTTEGSLLRKLVESSPKMTSDNRQMVAAFLSGGANAPGTSEIVGILDEMHDEMSRDLADLREAEATSVRQFEELVAAKQKEIAAATRNIEKKTQRSGQLAVKVVEGKNDLEDTREALAEDQAFKANLAKDCAHKEQEQNERVKTRAEEMQAIAETIKVLNDDDALDLFNKVLPKPRAAVLLQAEASTTKRIKERAQNIIKNISKTYKSTGLDLISLALHGKKVDFGVVMKLIDDMVVTLKNEQVADDEHREYCNKEFDTSEDKQNEIKRNIEDLTHQKEEAQTDSANLAKEIKSLKAGIAALDKSVAEATAQRKSEHTEFTETQANNQAAVDLIAFAKNRLNKFYNPKMYKPPPPRELSEEERIYSNMGGDVPTQAPTGIAGTGIGTATFLQTRKGAPPPPPETFGAYSKKSEESGGVIALIDMLTNDVKKDMTEGEVEEKNAQEDYEELMADSQKKRTADSKSITTKEQAKAEADGIAETASENLGSANDELGANKVYIADLHKGCDFLVENYDFRKDARSTETDALKKAKAVLNGADYSFVQTSMVKGRSQNFLGL